MTTFYETIKIEKFIGSREKFMGTQKEALKQAIKDEFLGRFRKMQAKEGDRLSAQWLYDEFLPSLSPSEEAALEETVAEMIHEGIITRTSGPRSTYELTRKGVELLCL